MVDLVTCGDPLYRCRCVKPHGHVEQGDKIHACGDEVCGGSWEWLDDVTFKPHSYPSGEYRGAVVPPPDRIADRDGRLFIEAGAMFAARRGGIQFIRPPEIGDPDG